MGTLAGWLDTSVGEAAARATLGSMAGAPPFQTEGSLSTWLEPGAALATFGPSRSCDLASVGSISAAIVGRPRWTDAGLAATAARDGHATAVIAAYRRQGDEFLRSLNGAFALAVIDGRRVLLAVDRQGVCGLCYCQPSSGGLVFGSTTDVVAAHPDATSTISEQAIFNFLYSGIIPSPRTIYHEQRKLLPAQRLVFEDDRLNTIFYWQMPYKDRTERSVQSLRDELMELLAKAAARSVEAVDLRNVGAFLSGGLDSSTITGLAARMSDYPVKTFTIGFTHDKYDESRYASITARHFGTEHHNHYLQPKDVVDSLSVLSRAFDEPFGNSSVVPAYCCARIAREHGIELMLAGDGGDELFAGNSRYVKQKRFNSYLSIPSPLRKGFLEPVLFGLPGLTRWQLALRLRGFVRYALMPMPDRLEAFNFYRNADLSQVLESALLAQIDPQEPIEGLREAYLRTVSDDLVQRMQHLDLKITLADNDLRKVNTACMAAGVGVAYPFLDDEVLEFSARIPSSLLLRRGERRWFFKQAVKDFLAPETLSKHKHGFGMPFTEWTREEPLLKELAVDCISSFRRRGYLRGDFLDRLLSADEAYSGLAWDVLVLELWLRDHGTTIRSRKDASLIA